MVVTARGPGSLNNSGKLFMEHALFIYCLRVKEGAKDVQGEKDKRRRKSKIKVVLGEKAEIDLFPHKWGEMERNRHAESPGESLYKANQWEDGGIQDRLMDCGEMHTAVMNF